MNAGIIIGIILIGIGAITFLTFMFMIIRDSNFVYKLPTPEIIHLAVAVFICGIIVAVFGACAAVYRPYNPNAVNEEHKVKCQVCERKFDNTSSDAKKIRKTNMCNQCYKNYNYSQDMMK